MFAKDSKPLISVPVSRRHSPPPSTQQDRNSTGAKPAQTQQQTHQNNTSKAGIALLSVFKGKVILSASDFKEVWMHYDVDGNGYIEKDEIDEFLRDLFEAQGQVISKSDISGLRSTLLECYDINRDGKIELSEMSKILPVEENFLLKFKIQNKPLTYTSFLRIWEHYDTDGSGVMDRRELEQFIRDLIRTNKNILIKPQEMGQITEEILEHFDVNKNGLIEKEELKYLLKVPGNYLDSLELYKNLTKQEFSDIFQHYDRDEDGYLKREELLEIVGDMMRKVEIYLNIEQLEALVESLIKVLDKNHDKKISKPELADLFFTSPAESTEQLPGASNTP